jgi:hypothetical protein
VISYVDPRNTLRQIAKVAKMSDMEIRRIVYGLLQAGLVELVRPQGAIPEAPARMFPTEDKEEQRSLVDRLIDRIRAR